MPSNPYQIPHAYSDLSVTVFTSKAEDYFRTAAIVLFRIIQKYEYYMNRNCMSFHLLCKEPRARVFQA